MLHDSKAPRAQADDSGLARVIATSDKIALRVPTRFCPTVVSVSYSDSRNLGLIASVGRPQTRATSRAVRHRLSRRTEKITIRHGDGRGDTQFS